MQWWHKKTIEEKEPTEMLINRLGILKSTLRIVKKEDFNCCVPFKVDFSGEDGEDFGGPRREFLQ